MGDVNAVQKGKVGKRIAQRAAGKATGRSLGKLFKWGIEVSPWKYLQNRKKYLTTFFSCFNKQPF